MRVYNFPSDEIHIKNNKGEELAKIGPDGVEIEGGSMGGGVHALEEKVFFDGVAVAQECPPAPYDGFPPLMILGDKPLDGSIKAIDAEFDGAHIVANRELGRFGFEWTSQDENAPIAFVNVPIYGDEHTLFSRTLEYSQGESIDVSEDFNNLVDNYDLGTVVVKINGQIAQMGDLDTTSFYISNA